MTLKEALVYDIQKLEQIVIPAYLSKTVGDPICNVISDLNTCCMFLDEEAKKNEETKKETEESTSEEPVTTEEASE